MVKCADCGFLCVRHAPTNELPEVHAHWRGDGLISPNLSDGVPRCFVMAFSLDAEATGASGDASHRFLQVINKQRDCPKFVPWVQGFSPKDHKTMLHEKTLLEMQERQRERERQWQEEQKRSDHEWQQSVRKADHARQQKQRVWDRVWGIVLLVLGVVFGGVFTLLVNWLGQKYLGK